MVCEDSFNHIVINATQIRSPWRFRHGYTKYVAFFHFIAIPDLPKDAKWAKEGITVAGGHKKGNAANQLYYPFNLFVDDDDDQTIVIVDTYNHRIMQCKRGDTNGQVVAGGNGRGDKLNQLNYPSDVLIDKVTNSLVICDWQNRRVVRWIRHSGTTQGEVLIDQIKCFGLAMDEQRNLYVSDTEKHEVRRYEIDRGDKKGTLVAGGNGKGARLNQLYQPKYLFVDRQQTLYVSDSDNHRVMKWNKGGKEGTVVAGGQDKGKLATQLSFPYRPIVDTMGTLYVTEGVDNRVTRWPKGAKQGTIIVSGKGHGDADDQFNTPHGFFFDKHGHLYVVDNWDCQVQRFSRE